MTRSRPFRLKQQVLAACVASTLLFAPAAVAEEQITLNFVGVDIESIVKIVGQLTGRNFALDPRVKGTVNVVSARPVPREQAYAVLVSALRLQGYAVVESGAVTKIVPDAEARTQAGPVAQQGQNPYRGDQIVTQVFQIRHEAATQLVNALRPLVGANQSIAANPSSNTLVITDSADNLRRIERIIAAIDVKQGDDPQIIPLRHASAVDVANTVTRLFATAGGQGGAPGAGLAITADPRANRVIVRADSAALLARAVGVIAGMDKPESGLGNIRVVHLKNAEATRIAQTLRAILGQDTGAQAGPATAATAPPPLMPTGLGMTTTSPATAPFAPPAAPATAALVAGSTIQADVASNSLIITAPESVFNNLLNVIEMLDRRRAQVHIEALIVELSAEKAAEFGIQWQDFSGINGNNVRAIGGTNFGGVGQNIISTAANLNTVGRGLNIGVVNGQINIPGVGTVTNLGFLARFLESDAQANVLSTPSIMTLDNEEARIVIGQNLPFVTGAYSTVGNTATVTPFQTYERRDVGLTLRVRPQITEGGIVRVQIYQEASSVQQGTANNTGGPITNKRALESSVLVDDGNIMVLGGLIEDSFGYGEDKVPVLGDLPVLGNLFRYETRKRKKTNLLVFLKPRIVREGLDYRGVTEDRYQMLLDGQRNQARAIPPLWGSEPLPQLPPLPAVTREGTPAK